MHFSFPNNNTNKNFKKKISGKGALPGPLQPPRIVCKCRQKGSIVHFYVTKYKIVLKGAPPPEEIVYPYEFRQKGTGLADLRVVEWVALIRFLFGMWHY